MKTKSRRNPLLSLLLALPAGACASHPASETTRVSGSQIISGETVTFTSVASGKVLDVVGASGDDGARIQQWESSGTANQQWILHTQPDGHYAIANVASGKCLDLAGGSAADGTFLQQWTCSGQPNQSWSLRAAPDGSFTLVGAATEGCVDLAGASDDDGAAIQEWTCAGASNQRWRVDAIGGGGGALASSSLSTALVGVPLAIVSAESGAALDVIGASTSDGALLQQWSYASQPNQQWMLRAATDGGFTVANVGSGKCLDVPGSSQDDGAAVQQYACWGGANQSWTVQPAAGGGYTLRSSASGRCLDVAGASTANGASIDQWTCSGASNQTFLLEPATIASPAPSGAGSLQAAAASSGKWIGSAISTAYLSDPAYTATAAREFNYVTPENEMKWDATEPVQGQFSFAGGDDIVAFAKAHGMRVKGHNLVWHNQLPSWVGALNSPGALDAAMANHIATVSAHYKGQVAAWDVVNEAIDDNPPYGIRRDVFDTTLGDGYIARAFTLAHAADPGALLFYNDYGIEGLGGKADGMFAMVQGLVNAGAPISGVGLQMHLGVYSPADGPTAADIAANMHRLAALGLLVNISEMDIGVCDVPGSESDKLAAQAARYHDIVAACMSEPRCMSVTLWEVADSESWLNGAAPCNASQTGQPWPLAFDGSFNRKPAWLGVVNALSGR